MMQLSKKLKRIVEKSTRFFVESAIRSTASIYFDINSLGKEDLPKGPAILVYNHVINFDGALTSSFLQRMNHFVIQREGVYNSALFPLFWATGNIPISVRTGYLDRNVLKRSAEYLGFGDYLGVFSEGPAEKLISEGKIIPIEKRKHYPLASLIALQNNVPIVPVGLHVCEELSELLWDFQGFQNCKEVLIDYHKKRGKKPKYVISYGQSISPNRDGKKKSLVELTEEIRGKVIEQYHFARDYFS